MRLEEYLERSVSPFHAAALVKERLEGGGFLEIRPGDPSGLPDCPGFFMMPYPSCIIAFKINRNGKEKFHIATAHTDSPSFKIKPDPVIKRNGYLLINTEPYGGSVKRTWLDRPLGIAGKVVLRTDDPFSPEEALYSSDGPAVIIPGLAPHLDREIETKPLDPQTHLLPVAGTYEEGSDFIRDLILRGLKREALSASDIIDYDLYLYNCDRPEMIGEGSPMISAPRIDNIASCAALTEALIRGSAGDAMIDAAAFFDNEEIGSRSKQGADSELLKTLLHYVYKKAFPDDYDAYLRSLYASMLFSVDGAHALHPSYPEKSDLTGQAYIGKGFVLKTSAPQRYVTDSKASSIVKEICRKNGIRVQQQANRSGAPGGQTLGPIASSYLPVLACDIGIPMLSMHSSRELADVRDYEALLDFLSCVL